jgi:CBS domain-containing protein
MLPLLVAAILAHGTTVLLLKRSILTEKVARRGFHLTREYSIDPLEILFVREVMRTKLAVLPAEATVEDLRHIVLREPAGRGQHLYPVVDDEKRLTGVVTRKQLRELIDTEPSGISLGRVVRDPVTARPDEPLRLVVMRMAETGLTRLPVVEHSGGRLVGMVSLQDLLSARVRNLQEERFRERMLEMRIPFLGRQQRRHVR